MMDVLNRSALFIKHIDVSTFMLNGEVNLENEADENLLWMREGHSEHSERVRGNRW